MYRCEKCNEVVSAGTRQARVVVEEREASYPYRPKVNVAHRVDGRGHSKSEWRDDPGGVGMQIVRELAVCPPCAQPH